jgi:hypothetical protein
MTESAQMGYLVQALTHVMQPNNGPEAAVSAAQKKQAKTYLDQYKAQLTMADLLQLGQDIQQGGRFDFLCRERGGWYRLFSSYGRTDTYRYFLSEIQAQLMQRFKARHEPAGIDQYATAMVAGEMVYAKQTLNEMRVVFEMSYSRFGSRASNAACQAFARADRLALEPPLHSSAL